MKNIIMVIFCAFMVGCASPSTMANQTAMFDDYATVVSSTPIYEVVYQQVPVGSQQYQQYCTQKPHSSLNMGTALGAVVGGLVGSQIGGGSGREVAIGVGAAAGAVTGNNINRNSHNGMQCTTSGGQQYQTIQQQVITGYTTQILYNEQRINIYTQEYMRHGQQIIVTVQVSTR